jgi:uncharacterized protein YukE
MVMTMTSMVAKVIHPPEAHTIAGVFRRAGSRCRALAADLRSQGHPVQEQWLGRSKLQFFTKFNLEPAKLHVLADWFMARANFIESLTVTIYVEVKQELPISPPT